VRKELSLVIVSAEADGRAAVLLEGSAAEVAAAAARYLETCPAGAVLQWPVGAGWSELHLHGDRSLAVNLQEAWHELEGIGCPPAILTADESDMARAIVPALLSAAAEL
jgi:hypothetical protein